MTTKQYRQSSFESDADKNLSYYSLTPQNEPSWHVGRLLHLRSVIFEIRSRKETLLSDRTRDEIGN